MSTVIVTGGFGTLGRAVVAELVARGHRVAAIDKANPPADHLATLPLGGVDLTDELAVTEAYRTIADKLGAIGGLVNVAGGFIWEPVSTGTVESWDRMYATNLRTCVVSTKAALPHLAESGSAIVNVGAAAQPGIGMAPYAASKSGVRAMTESLAAELKSIRVRVNAVLPTIIDTPANRRDMPDADTSAWVKPEAAAKVIAFLLSSDARAVSGASIILSLAG